MAGLQASARGVPSWSWHPGRVRRSTGDVLSIQAPQRAACHRCQSHPGEKGIILPGAAGWVQSQGWTEERSGERLGEAEVKGWHRAGV